MGKSKYETEGMDGYEWYEGQPKWPLRRILKIVFYSLSALVWLLVLGRLFLSGNNTFEDHLILVQGRAAELYPSEITQVTKINFVAGEQEDGSAIIYNPIYLAEVKNFQFTARINRRSLPPASREPGYLFVLRETNGGETLYHSLSYYASDSAFGYTFFRLCFEGVEMKGTAVYTFMIFPQGYQPQEGAEIPYPATDSLFHITVCNSDTYCHPTTPKASDFKTKEEL